MSVFRLDTMATSNKIGTLTSVNKPVITTKTDYQPKYQATLQPSSYNFTATNNMGELCAGIVKARAVHHKTPAQHANDLESIEKMDEFQQVFHNPQAGHEKSIKWHWS